MSKVWYQGILKATVLGVFQDLKFKVSECSDQNWSCPESAQLSSNTHETVAFNIPWYLEVLENVTHPNLHTFKSVISCHFFDFFCQHGIRRCLNRCYNKSFVSHNIDWNKRIRKSSIDSCQIQTCQLIPSSNRFQTSGLYRLIVFRESILFTILSKESQQKL